MNPPSAHSSETLAGQIEAFHLEEDEWLIYLEDSEGRSGFNQNNMKEANHTVRYNTKHFLAHTPTGAESDLNAAAAAPSQTEVTDLNCSDHSTT